MVVIYIWCTLFGRHNLRSYSCFQTNVLAKFVDNICIFFYYQPWAQFGGGRGERMSPHFFRRGGHNMQCPPTFFSLGFVFGEVSKIKVIFVTFCVKRFST